MRLLIVGDAIDFAETFSANISYSEDNETARKRLQDETFDVVVTRDFSGLTNLVSKFPVVVFLTQDADLAMQALELGVYDAMIWQENDPGYSAFLSAKLNKIHRRPIPDQNANAQHYLMLARNLPDMAVMLFDHNLRFVVVEGDALARRGYLKTNLEGRLVSEFIPDIYLGNGEPICQKTLNGESTRLELNSDGFYYDAQFLPITNQDDQVEFGMIIVKDVTEIRQFEAVLEETHENFVSLIDNIDLGIMLLDDDTQILLNNDMAFDLLGVEDEHLRGMRCLDLDLDVIDENGKRLDKADLGISRVLVTMEPTFNEVFGIYNAQRGERVWLMCSVVPLINEDGTFRHIVCSFSDITPLRNAREALYDSMSQYRLLADHIKDIIALFDENWRFIYVSPSLERVTGWKPADLIGETNYKFVHPDDLDKMRATRRLLSKSGGDTINEWRCLTKDGQYIWLETYTQRIYDIETASYRIISSSRDITLRHQAEENLRRQSDIRKIFNDLLRIFIDRDYEYAMQTTVKRIGEYLKVDRVQTFEIHVPTSTYSMRFEWCAEGVSSEFGFQQNLPIINEFSYGANQLIQGLPAVVPVTESMYRELYGTHIDTTQMPKSALISPIIHNDKLVGTISVTSLTERAWSDDDIHFLKFVSEIVMLGYRRYQFERELMTARDLAETANRAKSTFLANMSHELRTPLNAILGFAQLFERDRELSMAQRENISIIARSGEHLLELINDVLEMSKIEVGRSVVENQPFDLTKLIENLSSMLRLRAEAKGISYEMMIGEDVPRYINADSRKIRQALINLIGNAIKFTNDGGVMFRVMASQTDANRYALCFEVEDTGYGINEGEIPFLFEAFRQTESGRHLSEGSGLGLSISRDYVRLMGGEIEVESQRDVGSTFRFTIPVEEIDEQIGILNDDDIRRVIGLEPGTKRYRIMIVEDRTENRMLIYRLLSQTGFEIIEAENGQVAVDKFATVKPDIIFMDLRMPIMNGYEATQRIREIEGGRHVPIIALTASVFDNDEGELLHNGFDAIIRKPFRQREIFDTIAEYLGVSYVYTYVNIRPEVKTHILMQKPVVVAESMFNTLPIDVIGRLHKYARKADHAQVLKLLDDISPYNEDVAIYIKDLMDNFDFEKLVQLTQR